MRIGTILPVDDVISKIVGTSDDTILINNTPIRKTNTLMVFATHGTKCCCCGIEAAYFLYFENQDKGFLRLMVYRNTRSGNPIFLTKDHIIPKSKGGPNIMMNYQVMCVECNARKQNNINVQQVPVRLYPYLPKNLLQQVSKAHSKQSIDKLDISIHKEYIKWYTKTFHKTVSYSGWVGRIKSHMEIGVHSIMGLDFRKKAFHLAFDQLISEQAKYHHHTNKKSANKIKPAVYFANNP